MCVDSRIMEKGEEHSAPLTPSSSNLPTTGIPSTSVSFRNYMHIGGYYGELPTWAPLTQQPDGYQYPCNIQERDGGDTPLPDTCRNLFGPSFFDTCDVGLSQLVEESSILEKCRTQRQGSMIGSQEMVLIHDPTTSEIYSMLIPHKCPRPELLS
ncbi:uncharacterized protein LOC122282098 isoform X2 [Carya illinoinensis]|uniref:uncharacterized protein LOC122282098 isoform X2 n=1 Tax=Carya illinoinensis TaxID=32201 RepID=UPI001C723B68|nr:uncharacterized protein LOC122282098 isoform X2 [Carya illinoinensis]XP_042949980.1 uncharacterized protein LOC122282098 isoform X2 [Carya illinoinensis]